MSVLVTGGAGFIGSHSVVELQKAGYDTVVVDNFSNSNKKSLERVEEITGKKIKLYEIDLRDEKALSEVFDKEKIDAVIHFAGLKAVGESVEKPMLYYDHNLNATLTLLKTMTSHNVKKIIFSSSATVYGDPDTVPITEETILKEPSNPYGMTKKIQERILSDIANADPEWTVILLRYFNPIGAHESGKIGENPLGIPNNLMPYITQVAVGKRAKLGVFGNDYNTPDGTCIRDYIHVVDLARGHVKAMDAMEKLRGVNIYNLGTGNGYSVLEVIDNFEKATGVKINYEIQDRRPGDIAVNYASSKKAYDELGWKAQFGMFEMCRDAWNWQKNNPNGFED